MSFSLPSSAVTAPAALPAENRAPSAAADRQLLVLKRGVWAYFLLLVFEGALRKWFLPGLSTPLLVVRDPLALWLLVVAGRRGLLPATPYITGMVAIGVAGIFTATLLGHGNIFVALFGARILLLHFPLLFVIGRLFDRDDVMRLGRVLLWITIPMTLLIAAQFYSPQSAWVNRGVGGDMQGAGYSGAMGYFRPPGTFSFTNGNSSFFSLVIPFVFYFWLNRKAINTVLLLAATGALVLAVPLSLSRTLLFQVLISLVFVLAASSRKPEYLGRMLVAVVGGFIALSLLSQTGAFSTATQVLTSRFEDAGEVEGGLRGTLLDRFLGGMIGELSSSADVPFFGVGLGMGTNVGGMLLAGSRVFLVAEGEWGRIIGELGPLMGLAVIAIR
ncbi:MAG: hypothetical protein EOO61_00975, partial [Hymenobacter sp.]